MCGCFIWGSRSGVGWQRPCSRCRRVRLRRPHTNAPLRPWSNDITNNISNNLADVIVARAMERAGLADWIAEGEGKWSLPILSLPDDAGWVELMRLTLAGERRLNDGRVVRRGDYIHEPAGNVDWWEATGTETLLVHAVVKGSVEYQGPHHAVLQRITTADRRADYRRWCEAVGVVARDLC